MSGGASFRVVCSICGLRHTVKKAEFHRNSAPQLQAMFGYRFHGKQPGNVAPLENDNNRKESIIYER